MKKAAVALRRQALEELRLLDVREACASDPKYLINEIRYFDPVTQQWVEFRMFPHDPEWESPIKRLANGDLRFSREGAHDWYWQAEIIDWLHDPTLHAFLIYKARQLGMTLLACAYALWLMLFRPGTVAVAYSYEEGEARKLVEAAWMMYLSLPEVLREHVEVVTPRRSDLPSEFIRLRHRDGRMSTFQALPATERHGHGARVTFGIMDEVAKQVYGRRVYEAIAPATLSRGGKLALISTADGVSNLETGEGNFFHHLYATKREKGLRYVFLPWNAEPTRDQDWYEEVAMKLPEVERNRQFPLNETDGFMLSGALYFDREAMAYYRGEVIPPLFTGQFVMGGKRRAEFVKIRDGVIDVFDRPRSDTDYIIGVDTATGRSSDYTSAHVMDLSSGAIVAELHAKIEAPRAALQLHFLGKMYGGISGEALIGIERQGGYGDSLIIALRDGGKGMPPYRRLYRHKKLTSANKPISEEYGLPMASNRSTVIGTLATWLYERRFPWLSEGTMGELGTFVHAETSPSPRAQDGCNDDRVISLAITTFLYEQKNGSQPDKRKRWKKATYQPPPTRQSP